MDLFTSDVAAKSDERLQQEFDDFQHLYANELETYLVSRCTAAAKTWNRDYSSEEAYLQSVAPNREAWRDVLGRFENEAVTGELVETRLFHEGGDSLAHWVQFEFLPGVISRAVIARPANATGNVPVVVCQHGIGSSPFHVFGRLDGHGLYGAYALPLLEAGFAVVAPANRTTGPGRNRLERVAHLSGVTLFGLECFKLERLIDYVETVDGLDATRLGMSGLSLGGLATLFFTPLIDRIKAGCCMAWFNERRKKMVVIDPRYSCFLATQ
ncbi:MAG: hypothetical protein CO096_20170, partial [Armatimonadetes bacterium CG_4_9_14_3_um_filter_66_14]